MQGRNSTLPEMRGLGILGACREWVNGECPSFAACASNPAHALHQLQPDSIWRTRHVFDTCRTKRRRRCRLGIGIMLMSFLLGAAALIFCLWALIDAIQNPALDGTMRIVWVLVILLTNVLGAILYLLMG